MDAVKVFVEKPRREIIACGEEMGSDCSSSGVQELYVLAVDDNLVDRKVIEHLLKISCCKVTAVESGKTAHQYLGLDGERSSLGFDLRKSIRINRSNNLDLRLIMTRKAGIWCLLAIREVRSRC